MRPALVVIDLIKGNKPFFNEEHLQIIPRVRRVIDELRNFSVPIIFANDSYPENDWLFNFMKKHAVRGTEEVEVIEELGVMEGDIIVEKRRFSAFFRTDLDITLRELGVDTVVLAGINTHVCVLSTAFDAISNDFRVILLKDCCASHTREVHEFVVNRFRGLPAFQVMGSEEFLESVRGKC
ncbi:cysteine hydrolase family protein [Geoglobus acetivorans]|uniref:Isochorismatase hydrolase n=1 Tax=Geoglobus acetivorans TaxID=565033 RepID=A0A0A7GFW5_GEOAI|nr:isochorismatase hydrolase [Geoglobus acetivorans]